jgi:hypothetical protein
MTTEIVSLIFIFMAGALQAEAELIRFTPSLSLFPKAPWWKDNNWKYKSKFLETVLRYAGSIGKDGFHFTKSLSIVFHAVVLGLSIATSLDLQQTIGLQEYAVGLFFIVVFIYYVAYGIGFNARFHWNKWYEKARSIF